MWTRSRQLSLGPTSKRLCMRSIVQSEIRDVSQNGTRKSEKMKGFVKYLSLE